MGLKPYKYELKECCGRHSDYLELWEHSVFTPSRKIALMHKIPPKFDEENTMNELESTLVVPVNEFAWHMFRL